MDRLSLQSTTDPIVVLLYTIIREHVPAAKVEAIVAQMEQVTQEEKEHMAPGALYEFFFLDEFTAGWVMGLMNRLGNIASPAQPGRVDGPPADVQLSAPAREPGPDWTFQCPDCNRPLVPQGAGRTMEGFPVGLCPCLADAADEVDRGLWVWTMMNERGTDCMDRARWVPWKWSPKHWVDSAAHGGI